MAPPAMSALIVVLCVSSFTQVCAMLYVPSFTKYPGYDGDFSVQGQMSIETASNTQTLKWSLTGLDTACTSGAADSVANGCGIHIHTGTSCEAADNVGGHFYSEALASDPWSPVVYVAPDGASSGTGVEVVTGLSSENITGRVMVVHELASGARIACGVIGTMTGAGQELEVASFAKYPGYTGDLAVAGSMTIVGTSGTDATAKQTLTWSLTNLDTDCVADAADNVTNGCGIHVHTGTSCEVAGNVGGHFYSSAVASDPWSPVVYVAAADGSSDESTGVEVATGLSNGDITGRVMVVHELTSGARIACGVIQQKTSDDSNTNDNKVTASGAMGISSAFPHLLAVVCALGWMRA